VESIKPLKTWQLVISVRDAIASHMLFGKNFYSSKKRSLRLAAAESTGVMEPAYLESTRSKVGVSDSILEERNRLPPHPNILPHGLALYKCFRCSMRFIIKQIPHVLKVYEVEGRGSTISSSRRGTAFLLVLLFCLMDRRCTNTSAFP
jgi:hypothetical protein